MKNTLCCNFFLRNRNSSMLEQFFLFSNDGFHHPFIIYFHFFHIGKVFNKISYGIFADEFFFF